MVIPSAFLVALLVRPARADDLTFSCPAIVEPADAWPWASEAGGGRTLFERVVSLAYAAIPEECLDACTYSWSGACDEMSCTTAAGAVVSWEHTQTTSSGRTTVLETATTTRWAVSIQPVGETWASLELTGAETVTPHTANLSWSASWSGDLDGVVPADQSVASSEASWSAGSAGGMWGVSASWDDGTCRWQTDVTSPDVDGVEIDYRMDIGAQRVDAVAGADGCGVAQVSIDGGPAWGVAYRGWTWVPDDADRDGFARSDDCDDTNPAARPCGSDPDVDGVDEDCDGYDGPPPSDADGDGHRSDTDCDDALATVHPGALEACNGVDDDCDGLLDDAPDADGDGVGPCAGDCDDGDAAVSPVGAESCNGVDDDCDGSTDDVADSDGDGVGPCEGDCNDAQPLVHPGATDVCDGVDDDCDGLVDDGAACDTGAPGEPLDSGGASAAVWRGRDGGSPPVACGCGVEGAPPGGGALSRPQGLGLGRALLGAALAFGAARRHDRSIRAK